MSLEINSAQQGLQTPETSTDIYHSSSDVRLLLKDFPSNDVEDDIKRNLVASETYLSPEGQKNNSHPEDKDLTELPCEDCRSSADFTRREFPRPEFHSILENLDSQYLTTGCNHRPSNLNRSSNALSNAYIFETDPSPIIYPEMKSRVQLNSLTEATYCRATNMSCQTEPEFETELVNPSLSVAVQTNTPVNATVQTDDEPIRNVVNRVIENQIPGVKHDDCYKVCTWFLVMFFGIMTLILIGAVSSFFVNEPYHKIRPTTPRPWTTYKAFTPYTEVVTDNITDKDL